MKPISVIFLFLFASLVIQAQVQISQLKTENLVNPIGIDQPHPTLSWILNSKTRNVMQQAYEIKVADNSSMKGKMIWETGKVDSEPLVVR